MASAAASTSARSLMASYARPLRSAVRRATISPVTSRSLHSLPPLPASLNEGKGCEPLFSQQTVKLLWEDWHGGLLNKLNDEVRGTPWENSSVTETVIGTATDPQHIQAFNYASMALNNSFFLSGLKPKDLPPNVTHWTDVAPPKPPQPLAREIENHFQSLPAFKLAFSSAAYGMSSSGYVWLVQDRNGLMGIVPTFGAGTVLVQNRQQRGDRRADWLKASVTDAQGQTTSSSTSQSLSAAAESTLTSSSMSTPPFSQGLGVQARTFSSSARLNFDVTGEQQPGSRGEELFPLLCVSVHERDWLPDYGMWGREEYLMRFWECVDWARVYRLHEYYNVS